MKIIHIATEFSPIAKVGGLADVLLGLGRATKAKGHGVEIILPKYACIENSEINNLHVHHQGMLSFYKNGWHNNTIWQGEFGGLTLYFIDDHQKKTLFDRDKIYGYKDDIARFTYFSRAALDFIFKTEKNPDIIHLHEWQTAVVAPLYQELFAHNYPLPIRLITTLHNLEYQGQCPPKALDDIGLTGKSLLNPDLLQDPQSSRMLNLLKGGIIYSDYVTTVSPQYAIEIQSKEQGAGLHSVISAYSDKISGILNGVDYDYWNPETDNYIKYPYGLINGMINDQTVEQKAKNKDDLRILYNMPLNEVPLVICIARLVHQKGIKMIQQAIIHTIEKGGQFFLFGSSPIPHIQKEFSELAKKLSHNPNFQFTDGSQNEQLAHQLYAAGDIIIVPSKYEPCGLTQLIALKYGTIPVVRKTGGLADTIFDIDHFTIRDEIKNGYTFDSPTKKGILSALDRAIDDWILSPKKWQNIINNAMNADYSWEKSVAKYLELYSQKVPTQAERIKQMTKKERHKRSVSGHR